MPDYARTGFAKIYRCPIKRGKSANRNTLFARVAVAGLPRTPADRRTSATFRVS
jgi:hypothetical protein